MIDWTTTNELIALKKEIIKYADENSLEWDAVEIDNAILHSLRSKTKIAIDLITSKSGVTREKPQTQAEQTQEYLVRVLKENKFNFVQLQGYLQEQGHKIRRKELEEHLNSLKQNDQLPYEIRG